MINFKQEELIDEIINYIQKKYPEVKLIEVAESPEDSESLWLIVTSPEDEDRELELISYSADKSMDILLEYGYHILVMPTRQNELKAA